MAEFITAKTFPCENHVDDQPFASEPAEAAYQAALSAGATITRDQFRKALQVFTLEQEKSAKRYEEWRKAREDADKASNDIAIIAIEIREKKEANTAEEQLKELAAEAARTGNISVQEFRDKLQDAMKDMSEKMTGMKITGVHASDETLAKLACPNHFTGLLSGICPDCGKP